MLHLAITKSTSTAHPKDTAFGYYQKYNKNPPITQTLIPHQTKLHPDQLLKNREDRTHLVRQRPRLIYLTCSFIYNSCRNRTTLTCRIS